MKVISIKEKKKKSFQNSSNYLYKAKQSSHHISSRIHEKQPVFHFVIKAKLSASAPLALSDSYWPRWRPEEEDMSPVRKWQEIKLSNACRLQESKKSLPDWWDGSLPFLVPLISSLASTSILRRRCLLLCLEILSTTKRALGWLWLNDDLPAAVLWSTPVIHNGWTAAKMKSVDRTLRGIALRRKGEWMAWAE